ncbi:MAG: tRNA (adenosine(37)-N6)-dimethylallyltransferase MiaA [Crocinitomicaceae bacterium]
MSTKKKLIVIGGPTASGKTTLSVSLAKILGCSILSADSRQFFNELSIGTAKPSLVEMDGIKHYFIDSHSIQEDYTSGQFEHDALAILEEEFKEKDYVILVGGSGLYIDAVCKGIDDLPRNELIRDQLNIEFEESGIEKLQQELKEKDNSYYSTIDIQNSHRIIRALEVIRESGKKMSDFQKNKPKERSFSIQYFAIDHLRSKLYEKIDNRVIEMVQNGLIDEVKNVEPFRRKQALNTVGYKEVFMYLDHQISKEEMISLIQQNTRRYSKRQITWFKREKSTLWLDGTSPETWVNTILNKID